MLPQSSTSKKIPLSPTPVPPQAPQAAPTNPMIWVAALVAGGALFSILILVVPSIPFKDPSSTSGTQTGINTPPPMLPQNIARIADNKSAFSIGPKDAKVVIVEFLDFECPYCKQAAPITRELLNTYKNDSVRFVFRHFPLDSIHPLAHKASLASLCAREQGKFGEAYDYMYSQPTLSEQTFTDMPQILALKGDQFSQCLLSKKYDSFLTADMQDGVALGVSGTPTWFMNGQKGEGAIPQPAFEEIINKLLGK